MGTNEALSDWSKEVYYKGKRYKLLAIARHSETLEEMAVYQALYGDMAVWVRPLKMFLETICDKGISKTRFIYHLQKINAYLSASKRLIFTIVNDIVLVNTMPFTIAEIWQLSRS